jgi:hypothetical protein
MNTKLTSHLDARSKCRVNATYGTWLPWLAANADVLGFETRRTAAMLMKAASNGKLTSHLDDATALGISRQLWGNNNVRGDRLR